MESDCPGDLYAVGFNRFMKLIKTKRVYKIYLADDADGEFVRRVLSMIHSPDVAVDSSMSAAQIAERFGIEVPTGIVSFYA